jgi:membrane-bound serine protease (ClpP class)
LHTKGREVVFREMNARQGLLAIISDPNVAYILLMLGLVGLYFELSNPGLILPGVVGGISMILAMYAMHTLPINYAGLLLILLGIVLFIAEIKIMSYGLLSVGGVVSICLGSLMLIESEDPAMRISRTVLFPTLAISAMIAVATVYLAVRTFRLRPASGVDGLIGEKGVVKTDLAPVGKVFVHGETWNAECDGEILAGESVTVQGVEGLKLKVTKTKKE